MDIARGGDIEPGSTNYWRWEAVVISPEIYNQFDDSALSCACDQMLARMPSFCEGMQTCLAHKRHKTWISVVACAECCVRAVANGRMESVGHYGSISPVVLECRKLSILPDHAKPSCVFVIFVQNVLFSGSCLHLQDGLDFLSGTIIGSFVRNRFWSFPLHLMRCLLFPTTSTENAFADIAVFPIRTVSFTVIAKLVTRTLPACASALGGLSLNISGEPRMSAFASAGG